MNTVEIYTKGHCPYCHRAKALLEQKGVTYTEFKVDVQPELRPEMITRANGGSILNSTHLHQRHFF